VESAVDPTRSQNITVSWRRSASGAAVGATGATGTDKTGGRAIGAAIGASAGGLEGGRADKGKALSALVARQAHDDQLVADILERFVVEPEFLLQPAIADALFQVQQADDESQGLRERSYGAPFSETRIPRMDGPDSRTDKHSITFRALLQPLLSHMDIAGLQIWRT
jgi:hypothetical protein